ncbi:MAG: hypothetical protein JWO31_410 [Phycisphaerales bacterium]|nr:hypothetical protein [Phycisphaerales bacterium]
MPSDPKLAADACAESLLAYQGVVVHDLRGDLNGLLLTVDFLRRQLGGRPDIGPQITDTLGDIDHARDGLLRTLNQLEMVGHARRVAGGRAFGGEGSDQDLAAVVAEVMKHQLADRARRRQVDLVLPEPGGVTLRADGVLLQLVVQRLLSAFVDLARKTELRVTAGRQPGHRVVLGVTLADSAQFPADLLDRATAAVPGSPAPAALSAVALAAKLAGLLGGALVAVGPEEGGGLRLELPDGTEGEGAGSESSPTLL